MGPQGLEIRRRKPALTMDVEFSITGASASAVELLNLLVAVSAFLNRNRWLELPRNEADPAKAVDQWELDPVGEVRTNLDSKDDVKAFSWGLVVRGFDVDQGLPLDLGRPVTRTEISLDRVGAKA